MAIIIRSVLLILLRVHLIQQVMSSSRSLVLEDSKHEIIDPRIECRDSFCEEITIRFEAFGEHFALYLYLKKNLFSPNYFEGTQHSVQRSFPKNGEVGGCRYYSGTRDFWAAVSVCDQREVNGVFRNERKEGFHVHFNEKMQENQIFRDDDLPTEPLGRSICTVEGSEKYMPRAPVNRTSSGIKSKSQSHNYLELLLVNDKKFYKDAGSNSKSVQRFDLDLVNLMNLAYNKVGINVVVMGIIVWQAKDEIQISTNSSIMFRRFQAYATSKLYRKYRYDSCHLLSGVDFQGPDGVLGVADLNAICTKESVGISYREKSKLATVYGNIVIHEVGHNLGLEHNSFGCRCSTSCFMSEKSSRQQTTEWSSCSKDFMKQSSTQKRFDICLKNLPSVDPPFPVCGNGHIERGEQCDCPANDKQCVNCCDIKTCKLKPGGRCSSETCCHSCNPVTDGRVCRPSVGECDFAEKCTGEASCPSDNWKQTGSDCDQSRGSCFESICKSRDIQCKSLFGPTSADVPKKYYKLNAEGVKSGHCGHIFKPVRGFKPCHDEDIFCGLFWCRITHPNNIDQSRIVATGLKYKIEYTGFDPGHADSDMGATVVFEVTEAIADPALAWDFAKCGDNKWCSRGKCVSTSRRECPENCNPPNGVCDLLTGVCKCKTGFDGSDCSQKDCPDDCNGNGKCEKNGICTCLPDYQPPNCRDKPCPGNCNDHGTCNNGQCKCDEGFLPPSCAIKRTSQSTVFSSTTSNQSPETKSNTDGSGSKIVLIIALIVGLMLLLALIISGSVYYMSRKSPPKLSPVAPTAPRNGADPHPLRPKLEKRTLPAKEANERKPLKPLKSLPVNPHKLLPH